MSENNPLQTAIELCSADMHAVDDCIRNNLQSDVEMIPAVGTYIVNSGGKRLRPLLCLLTAKLFGFQGVRHIPLAVVIEFIHTASLLHDDVVDASFQRRGTPSANGVWGNQASVLVGDFLFSRAFQMMVVDGDMEMLRLMADVTNALAEGEVLQLARTFHLEMSEDECLEVIERKTAVLFSAASEIGARVSGRDAKVVRDMAEFGMCLGVAFQLMDDALDYSADAETVGKPVGHDLEEGKITMPLIHAMSRDPELVARVNSIADRGEYADGDREWVRDRVRVQKGDIFCMEKAKAYAERAKLLLPNDTDDKFRSLMARLADFSAQRPF